MSRKGDGRSKSNKSNNNNDDATFVYAKKRNQKQSVFLIIFGIVMVLITSLAIHQKTLNNVDNIEHNTKNNMEDSKYVITDFREQYMINPISIEKVSDYIKSSDGNHETDVNYIIVSGLKNVEIQNRINKEIKDLSYKDVTKKGKNEDYHSYVTVGANFCNILSVNISVVVWNDEKSDYTYEQEYALTYNLVTGERIYFEDLFASYTPLNVIISDVAYEALAWDHGKWFEYGSEEWQQNMNMQNRDTSEYDDILLKTINNFNRMKKEEIEFYITSTRIWVKLKLGNSDTYDLYSFDQYKYAEYITLYKKYIVNNIELMNIYYEMPSESKLLFANDIQFFTYYNEHIYDNLYLKIMSLDSQEYEEEQYGKNNAKLILKNELEEKYVLSVASEIKAMAQANKNYGYIGRALVYTEISQYENDVGKKSDYIRINIETVIDRCDIKYYNNAFKALAKDAVSPRADVYGAILGELKDDNIEKIDIPKLSFDIYFDTTGKVIATSWEEFKNI